MSEETLLPQELFELQSDVTTPCPKADLASDKDMANYLRVFIVVLLSYTITQMIGFLVFLGQRMVSVS